MITFFITLGLLFLSGLFSGLNLGFMSLGKEELERKIKAGNKKAEVVYKLRKNGNYLLCTILIGNVLVNNSLAIFMGDMFTGTAAILIATALVVVFGEILPQAICSRYPLQVGAMAAPIFQVFMVCLWPISKPLSWAMDKALGPEPPVRHSKFEIGEMILDHKEDTSSEIDEREAKTVIGALTFSDKIAREVMTPKKNVYRFYEDQKLTTELIENIKDKGHTRIPVFKAKKDQVVGVVLVKKLLGVRKGSKVVNQAIKPITVRDTTNLDDILDIFRNSRQHLLVVVDEHENVLGIITLEDIHEEIFGYEIVDETDKFEDMRTKEKKV
jgi:metal transporter CNNM